MYTLGLTGGIGSGKSTVAGILAAEGAKLIDADAISRAATQAGGVGMSAIKASFGDHVISDDGGLCRSAMREIMLQDAQAKTQLEAILHPLIGQQIHHELNQAQGAGVSWVVLDIPLLIEGGSRWRSRCHAVWVVDCLPATQIARVQSRSGWSVAQIESVMALQADRLQRLAGADAVIFNDGVSLTELAQQVLALLRQQKQLFTN